MSKKPYHIVIDARIRRASTGRPVDRLLQYLQELDTENAYTILLEPDDTWKPTNSQFSVLPIGYKQFSFNPLQQLGYARLLYRLKADLVHFTLTAQQPLFYFGKQVTMTHDLTMLRFVRAGTLPSWVHQIRMVGYKLLFGSGNRRAKTIIVPTEYVKKDLAAQYPFTKNKTVVTLESSEPPIADAPVRPKGVVLNAKFLLAVGSAFPHKNLQGLVDAFVLLQKKYPELKLYFAGKKEYHYSLLDSYIEQKANTGSVKTLGFVGDAELKWLYQNCLVYVFPSFSEGFGLPGLEAMVHGAPVASSNATCLPEVNGDAALYFDPYSAEDIASQIAKIIDTESVRQDLIKKGYKQAAQFSWKRMAQQTLEVYKQALDS